MKPLVISLDDGKQAIVSSDPRTKEIWIQLNANRGSLGLSLSLKQAAELSCGIVAAIKGNR